TPLLVAATKFWVRISNDCGAIDSSAASLNVVATCTAPAIVSQPKNQAVSDGSTATLTIVTTGTSLAYEWYQGQRGDFTNPVGGSSPSMITPPITTTTQFWVRVRSACGLVDSATATVTEIPRRRPSR